jgi:lysine 2,3-aminomutase
MEALRGHTSGYAVPTFCVDLPGGGGKVPVMPNYLLSQSKNRLVFRNFEGYISTYTEPTDYHPPKKTKFIPDTRIEDGQRGVAGLLAGERMTIKPAGWDNMHERDDGPAPASLPDAALDPTALDKLKNVDVAPEGKAPTWVKVN